jgi:hypothetical protein
MSVAVRLRGNPCQVYTVDLKVRTARSIRYPDAFVVCTPVPPSATVVEELGADAVLDLPEPGLQVPLAEFYEGVVLEPNESTG